MYQPGVILPISEVKLLSQRSCSPQIPNKQISVKMSADKPNKETTKLQVTQKEDAETEVTPGAEQPLFPASKSGKRTNYGTNDTLELLERIPTQIVEMKLDEVLTAVKTVDNLCDYPRCKAKTSLMGQDCEHCKKRYCFKHALPEVHGCGEAVRKAEHQKFQHPKPLKTVRQEAELAQAKKKLHSKLKDMESARKSQPAAGKKSK